MATQSLGAFEQEATADQGDAIHDVIHARPQRAFWLNAITDDRDVPEGCRVLAQYLFRHVGRDGTWWRWHRAMADEMGVSLSTLARRIRGLRERGYLDVEAYFQPSQRGRQAPGAFGIRLPNGLRHSVPAGPSGCVPRASTEPVEAPPEVIADTPTPVTVDTPPRVVADTPTRVIRDTPQKRQGLQEAGSLREVPPPPPPSPHGGRGFIDAEEEDDQGPSHQVLTDALSVMFSVGDARQELGMAPIAEDDYGAGADLAIDYLRAGVEPVRLCAAMTAASRWTRRSIDGQLNRMARGELRAGDGRSLALQTAAEGEYGEPA